MPLLSISEVARQVGLRASAIRYYEQVGILLPAQRTGGQRRYDESVLYRLAVIQRARQTGFTLDEIRELFFGFREAAPASQRWQKLSRRKLAELEELRGQIRTMQDLLQSMMDCCHCATLDQCGKGILRKGLPVLPGKPFPAKRRRSAPAARAMVNADTKPVREQKASRGRF